MNSKSSQNSQFPPGIIKAPSETLRQQRATIRALLRKRGPIDFKITTQIGRSATKRLIPY